MDRSKPGGLVELVTHTSVTIGGENIVQRKREWVRPDDPRLATPGGYKFVYGPTAANANSPSENSRVTAAHGSVGANEDAPNNPPASELCPAGAAPVAQREAAAEGGCAREPAHAGPAEAAQESSRETSTTDLTAKTTLSTTLSVSKKEPQREAAMANNKNEDYYEDAELEPDEEEEDGDRPWPITRRTLAAIDEMSPEELENLIENVDDHERWQELREDAKSRTSQWLSGIKKAEEAPRCQFVKVNGKGCGSPALNGETMCYFHGDARARRQTEEEARSLGMPTLEDKLSVQLAIMRVCNQLIEKSLDDKTGRTIISALRLAHRNIGDQDSLL
jgi:hypothetical protein